MDQLFGRHGIVSTGELDKTKFLYFLVTPYSFRSGVVDTHLRKHPDFQWLVKVHQLCKDVYNKFNYGKNYNLLVDICEELELRMRHLTNFSTTRFANSIRLVTRNLRADFQGIIRSLYEIESELQDKSGAQYADKLADARRLLKEMNNRDFCLKLSGITDVYEVFGEIATVVQTVNLLPFERYDRCLSTIDKFEDMEQNMKHEQCLVTGSCKWPLFHNDLETLKSSGLYMEAKVEMDFPGNVRRTRELFRVEQRQEEGVVERVTEKLLYLASKLKRDLRSGMFTEEVSRTIEDIRQIADLNALAARVKQDGAVAVGLQEAETFAEKMSELTNTLDRIPKEEIKSSFKNFVRCFSEYIEGKEVKDIDNKEVYKDFLSSEKGLYKGNEIMMHSLCVVAVKYSVESSVESLISRYETHFDRKRQLTEENAHHEMVIAESGPILVHADPLLTRALNKYFRNETQKGEWHFYHTDESRFYPPEESKTIKRLQSKKSKLSFMDK